MKDNKIFRHSLFSGREDIRIFPADDKYAKQIKHLMNELLYSNKRTQFAYLGRNLTRHSVFDNSRVTNLMLKLNKFRWKHWYFKQLKYEQ